jgi:uracil-DNA glycosylase
MPAAARCCGMCDVTETVKAWREFAPDYLPLPHPSARNTPRFQCNPCFEQDLLPVLSQGIASIGARGGSP